MVLLHLAVLVTGAVAQQCSCNHDRTNGYWTGLTCGNCDFGVYSPLDTAATNQAATCTILDSCKDTNRPLAERTCYGVGVCNSNNAAMPCNCTATTTGLYCEKCRDGFEGWPSCLTPSCVGPNSTSSGTCNGHGSCLPSNLPVACGVSGGGGGLCDASIPGAICAPVPYTPGLQQCVGGATAGTASAVAVSAGESACGPGPNCKFGSKCADPARGICCPNDYTFCAPRSKAVAGQCCHPTATCCEGVCCDTSKSCNKIVNRAFTVRAIDVDPGSLAYGGGPATEWKMIDGSTAEPWHTCSADYLGAVATTRVIILPLCLLFAVLVSLILVWKAVGLNPLSVAIPAVLLIFCCIFLFFSPTWPTAIVIAFGALFGMGATHKGGSACIAALVIEFFALAVVTGGLGLGQFFYAGNAPSLFGALNNGASSPHDGNWFALSQCSNYYDFFAVDPTNIPYDADPARMYKNYCSEGWYTYLGLIADFVVTFQIIMLAATGVTYLGSGSTGKSV